jgi:pyrimidine operon attenuation protein/uracil phosphoribosyltransferase
VHDDQAVEAMLHSMSEALKRYLEQKKISDFRLVGIRTGGVWVARALNRLLDRENEIGELDISFYRDDFTRIGLNPCVTPSNLPFETEDQHIVLVDDVLMSGRTVRAAMNLKESERVKLTGPDDLHLTIIDSNVQD